MATLFVDKIDPQSGTSLEIGSSGDTITIPTGANIQSHIGGTIQLLKLCIDNGIKYS